MLLQNGKESQSRKDITLECNIKLKITAFIQTMEIWRTNFFVEVNFALKCIPCFAAETLNWIIWV